MSDKMPIDDNLDREDADEFFDDDDELFDDDEYADDADDDEEYDDEEEDDEEEWEWVYVDDDEEIGEDEEWEYVDEDEDEDGPSDDANPLAYKKVQSTTDDLNHIYHDGVEVARELKGAYDDIKSLMDFKNLFKL